MCPGRRPTKSRARRTPDLMGRSSRRLARSGHLPPPPSGRASRPRRGPPGVARAASPDLRPRRGSDDRRPWRMSPEPPGAGARSEPAQAVRRCAAEHHPGHHAPRHGRIHRALQGDAPHFRPSSSTLRQIRPGHAAEGIMECALRWRGALQLLGSTLERDPSELSRLGFWHGRRCDSMCGFLIRRAGCPVRRSA